MGYVNMKTSRQDVTSDSRKTKIINLYYIKPIPLNPKYRAHAFNRMRLTLSSLLTDVHPFSETQSTSCNSRATNRYTYSVANL